MAGMITTTLTAAANPGDTSVALAAVTNLKPGQNLIIGDGVNSFATVANTYAGSTTVLLDGAFKGPPAASGVHVQYDGSTAPTIS